MITDILTPAAKVMMFVSGELRRAIPPSPDTANERTAVDGMEDQPET
jgi:hypothetical protein